MSVSKPATPKQKKKTFILGNKEFPVVEQKQDIQQEDYNIRRTEEDFWAPVNWNFDAENVLIQIHDVEAENIVNDWIANEMLVGDWEAENRAENGWHMINAPGNEYIAHVPGNEWEQPPVHDPLLDYYNRRFYNDEQNVHDSNVVNSTTKKYRQLQKVQPVTGDYIESLKRIATPQAQKVIEHIQFHPGTIGTLGTTDYEVLNLVSNRFLDKNLDTKPLIEALENCRQKGDIVCVTGRVANILDSLTLIDPIIGKPMVTLEMIRKDALADTYKIISNLPPESREIYESDSPARAELQNNLSNVIRETITKRYSEFVEKQSDLTTIIDDAIAGLD